MPKLSNQERAQLIIRPTVGDQFVTTRPVALVCEKGSGPNCTSWGRADIPQGTKVTYAGDFLWGSDPGPGFPKFKVHFPSGDVECHAVGEDLEYVSWPLSTWLKSI